MEVDSYQIIGIDVELVEDMSLIRTSVGENWPVTMQGLYNALNSFDGNPGIVYMAGSQNIQITSGYQPLVIPENVTLDMQSSVFRPETDEHILMMENGSQLRNGRITIPNTFGTFNSACVYLEGSSYISPQTSLVPTMIDNMTFSGPNVSSKIGTGIFLYCSSSNQYINNIRVSNINSVYMNGAIRLEIAQSAGNGEINGNMFSDIIGWENANFIILETDVNNSNKHIEGNIFHSFQNQTPTTGGTFINCKGKYNIFHASLDWDFQGTYNLNNQTNYVLHARNFDSIINKPSTRIIQTMSDGAIHADVSS